MDTQRILAILDDYLASLASIIDVTDQSYAECVMQSKKPVLLAFCGDGCSASQRLLALLAKAGPQCGGTVTIAKTSPIESPELATRIGIVSVPCLLLLRGGTVSYQFFGELSRRELDELLARASSASRTFGEPTVGASIARLSAEP